MNAQGTAAALASALPGGITYILGGGRDDWTAAAIAEFQAERLAEAGYVLLHGEYIDDETVERVAEAVGWFGSTNDQRLDKARLALAALARGGR